MSVDTNNWTNWTDQQWAGYLRTSSDPDDQSLAARLWLVERLKLLNRLNQREEQLFQLLLSMNAVELDYLKKVAKAGPTAFAAAEAGRPAWPRWHWPDDLLALYQRTI